MVYFWHKKARLPWGNRAGGGHFAKYRCYIAHFSARTLDSLRELFGTVGGGEGVNHRDELIAQ